METVYWNTFLIYFISNDCANFIQLFTCILNIYYFHSPVFTCSNENYRIFFLCIIILKLCIILNYSLKPSHSMQLIMHRFFKDFISK